MRQWFLIWLYSMTWASAASQSTCEGKFPNIVHDVCWECIFPIRIGGANLTPSYEDASAGISSPICVCPKPPFGQSTPGIRVSFWEPVRLIDVTRTPYCLVNLGGQKIAGRDEFKSRGTIGLLEGDGGLKHSFYQVHWYVFPIFAIFELFTDFALCIDRSSFDLAYMSELDPFWNNDELAILHNPEALVFSNQLAQAACAADCAKASFGPGFDELFWCDGCHGSIYPFTGSVPAHVSSVQATELLAARFIAKLHRYGLAQSTSGDASVCGKSYAPIIKKSQYRLQMINPIPATQNSCVPLGRSDFIHPRHETREVMKRGNHYGYLVWRRRECCVW